MDAMGLTPEWTESGIVADCVDTFRGLPLHLSGGSMAHIAKEHNRVEAVQLMRDSVMRWVAREEPLIAEWLADMWDDELTVVEISPVPGYQAGGEAALRSRSTGPDAGAPQRQRARPH